jgi:hypothetical protein
MSSSLLLIKPSENTSTILDRDPQRTNYAQVAPSDSNSAHVKA